MAQFSRDESLSRYIEQVRAIPNLSREAERELATKAKTGDTEAARQLVEANLKYAVAVAIQYRRYGVRLSDLVSEATVGLMVAVRKFDPELGNRFVTYAGYWIRAYVLDAVVRSTTMVGGGTGPFRSKIYFRLRRERARLTNLIPDPEQRLQRLAEEFQVTPDRMRVMLRRLDSRDVSLDTPLFDDSEATLKDTLVEGAPSQHQLYSAASRQKLLEERLGGALKQLDQRERLIVEKRIMGDAEMSLAAIGRILGVSRERARQLEVRAKKKLREWLADLGVPAEAAEAAA